MLKIADLKIAFIGLGYFSLPLALEFGRRAATVGFDINEPRVAELSNGPDFTLEVSSDELQSVDKLVLTDKS